MRRQSIQHSLAVHLSLWSGSFKVLYGRLKDMKTEIEHVQHLLEKAKVQLQKDFDVWWKQQASQVRFLPPLKIGYIM